MSWLQWALAPPRGQGEEVPTGSDLLQSFLSLTLLHQPATICGVLVTKDKIKRRLPLGRKAMTNLDSVLKSRDIALPTKVHLIKALVFPVVRYGCESWTIKKAECQRINAFELRCWMTFESPLGCKEIHQVHPKGYQSWMFIERTDAEA